MYLQVTLINAKEACDSSIATLVESSQLEQGLLSTINCDSLEVLSKPECLTSRFQPQRTQL